MVIRKVLTRITRKISEFYPDHTVIMTIAGIGCFYQNGVYSKVIYNYYHCLSLLAENQNLVLENKSLRNDLIKVSQSSTTNLNLNKGKTLSSYCLLTKKESLHEVVNH